MKPKEINSHRVPIYRNTGFELFDSEITSSAFKSENTQGREPDIYIYSRYRNPTVVSAEEEIMKVEKCEWALLTQSGMSAIDTAVSVFQNGEQKRPWLFFSEIYGGTITFADSILKKRRGLDIKSFSPVEGRYNLDNFKNFIKSVNPEFVYIETISNPLLIVSDVVRIIEIAKNHGSRVIVDNTFATPLLFRPLDYGADIVVHSATKYLGGHGNVTAGVICGNDPGIMHSAIEYRKLVGHMLSPDDAYRLQTQLMSLELRFTRQCKNAFSLAKKLEQNDLLEKVFYPGLPGHTTHDIASKLFEDRGFGAMITFSFSGKDAAEKRYRRDKFIKNVSGKIKLVPTLGDHNTILMPVESVWGAKYPEPGMIRLSIGFEDYKELEQTVSGALTSLLK